MTVRAKPVVKRSSRHSRVGDGRRMLLINIAFALVIVAAVAILVAAAGASWYGDHLTSVASVNGVSITRDAYRTRYAIEDWRITESESRLRDEAQAGRITSDQRDQATSSLEQQRQQLSTTVLSRLVDTELQRQLAAQQGISVSDADVSSRLTEEATRPEERHIYAVEVAPQTSSGAKPTDYQVLAARVQADQALKDLKSGKKFEDVAKQYSTTGAATSGGDIGWYSASSTLDKPFIDAMFAAQKDQVSGVIEGADGTFRIGKVVDVSPKSVDQAYQQKIQDAHIAISDYRAVIASDLIDQRLTDKITASVTDQPVVMRRVGEIYVPQPSGKGDEVHVRHILFSPNHITDQTQLQALPQTDPAWAKAKSDAQAAYDKLKAFVGKAQLDSEFQKAAAASSDDSGTKVDGGQLPWITRDQLDPGFGDAVFKTGLKAGDLIGPVQSSFGWHIILFEERRPDPTSRINTAGIAASANGADFAAVAKQYSEGPDASKGGDMGWIARYQLSADKEKAIFATPIGGTSGVINIASDGEYIFHVYEEQTRKPEGDQLATLKSSAFTNWYTQQKAAAKITQDDANVPTPATQ
ncbi:MAG TPA: peptidylprolyl isomerase [Candidatus Dormibacteraeota bacterium]|nr:peptidylprolyl isomerase [Candidatus Dormibacteraeota bacterium]